jgi:ribosomal protein S18 acetylase RimI-like enzyme
LDLPPSAGFEASLGVVLTASRPPDRRPAPGGLTIRPLRSAYDWREELRLRRAESAEDGPLPPGHTEYLLRRTAESARLAERGRAAYVGAFEGDRLCSVVGIASDGRGVARYQNVATRPEFRRRGLASLLVAEAGAYAASALGAGQLVIVADHGSHAARLYESLGFTPVEATLDLTVPPPLC